MPRSTRSTLRYLMQNEFKSVSKTLQEKFLLLDKKILQARKHWKISDGLELETRNNPTPRIQARTNSTELQRQPENRRGLWMMSLLLFRIVTDKYCYRSILVMSLISLYLILSFSSCHWLIDRFEPCFGL